MADCACCKWATWEADDYNAYVGEPLMQLDGCDAPKSYGNLERFFDGCGTDFSDEADETGEYDCPAFVDLHGE